MRNDAAQQGENDPCYCFVLKVLLRSALGEMFRDGQCQEKVMWDLNKANVSFSRVKQRLSREKMKNCVPIRPEGLLETAAAGPQWS